METAVTIVSITIIITCWYTIRFLAAHTKLARAETRYINEAIKYQSECKHA